MIAKSFYGPIGSGVRRYSIDEAKKQYTNVLVICAGSLMAKQFQSFEPTFTSITLAHFHLKPTPPSDLIIVDEMTDRQFNTIKEKMELVDTPVWLINRNVNLSTLDMVEQFS